MPTTYTIFLSLAVSHLLVLGVYILLYHRRSVLGLLSACLVFTLISGLIGEGLNFVVNSEDPALLIYVTMALNRLGNISMFLIWLLALKLFDDSFMIQKVHVAIWVLAVTSLIMRSIGSYYAHYAIELSVFASLATWGYSQLVLLGFSLAAIYVAIKGFRSDLIVERRHERVIFVICAASLLLLMAANRGVWVFTTISEGVFLAVVPLPSVLYSIYAYFITVAFFLWSFRIVNFSVIHSPAQATPNNANEEQVARERELSAQIQVAMEEEKLYRISSLTVLGLAKRVASQEYLVRRAINNRLGYRNFSEFLNSYRIRETTQLLKDTDEPITNIGLDVGYTSLSSFYTAFKSMHDVTPKQYRALHSQKS